MDTQRRDFDKEAAAWDEQPARLKLADDVAQAIRQRVTLGSDMDLLDFGCGTGLLSLRLQASVRSVTGVDTSAGMLDVFRAKAEKLGLIGVEARQIDLEQGATLPGEYDVVVSSMTLHHVEHVEPLLAHFFAATRPHGFLCLADLDPENGQFHDKPDGVFHNGFDRTALREALERVGYREVTEATAAEITKPAANGELRTFTVFLISGQKPA